MNEFGYYPTLGVSYKKGSLSPFPWSHMLCDAFYHVMATISSSSPDASAVWLDSQHLESKIEIISITHNIPCLQHFIVVSDNRLRHSVLSTLIK